MDITASLSVLAFSLRGSFFLDPSKHKKETPVICDEDFYYAFACGETNRFYSTASTVVHPRMFPYVCL